VPSLSLPGISRQELIALRERFALYVHLPKSFWPYIERSESGDETGERLTKELYRVYDEFVLPSNGTWTGGREEHLLLETLARTAGDVERERGLA